MTECDATRLIKVSVSVLLTVEDFLAAAEGSERYHVSDLDFKYKKKTFLQPIFKNLNAKNTCNFVEETHFIINPSNMSPVLKFCNNF